MTRFLVTVAMLAAIGFGGTAIYNKYFRANTQASPFRTEKVTRGDMFITVRATGTVEPEDTVDIGAQVVGRIKELGKDPHGLTNQNFAGKRVDYETPVTGDDAAKTTKSTTTGASKTKARVAAEVAHVAADPSFVGKTVDYGSPVVKGMVLAQIDPAIYQAQFDQASASVAQAKARVLQAEAVVAQTKAEWDRAQRLRELKISSRSPTGSGNEGTTLPIRGISDADYVLAQANAASATADLEAAKAAVLQQEATLALARTNLEYTTIYSPIDGTIIARRVNIGQTVVASLNAPSLFLIARDLRRMQVWAQVNEADIAKVAPGTKVHFRVDALPQDSFRGTVIQRRLNAAMTQNVVTYTVVIDVDNSDLKLLPYLTADVFFEVDERKEVLLVPNSALRYKPNPAFIEQDEAASGSEAAPDAMARRGAPEASDLASPTTGRLWVANSETNKLRPIEVQLGVSDSNTSLTEITGGDVKEGEEIVVGESFQAPAAGSGDVNNPLGPPRFRGRRS